MEKEADGCTPIHTDNIWTASHQTIEETVCVECIDSIPAAYIHEAPQNQHGATYESESEIRSVVSDSLWPHGLYSLWNSSGQDTGVGSLSLLQGIFPTQGSNPGLPHCRQILYQLSHRGSMQLTGVFNTWTLLRILLMILCSVLFPGTNGRKLTCTLKTRKELIFPK